MALEYLEAVMVHNGRLCRLGAFVAFGAATQLEATHGAADVESGIDGGFGALREGV